MKEEKKIDENDDQSFYDIFVSQGIKIASGLAGKLQGNASIDTLGNTLYEIVKKIETEGAKHGIKFPLSVLLHGSNEILGHLINVSQVKVEEEQIKATIGIAVGRYIEDALKTGKMSKEELGQFAQQAQGGMGQGEQPAQEMPQPGTGGLING